MDRDGRVKSWITDHVMPLFESTVIIFRLLFLLVVVYLCVFYRDLMETTVEVPLQVLVILYLLIALPNLLDAVWRLWRFLRTMGEIDPPGKPDLEES